MFPPVSAIPLLAALIAPALAQDGAPPATALFLAPEGSTAGAAVAAGPDGTVHMVLAAYNHGGDGAVVYAACAADCDQGESWDRVELPVAGVVRAEIALAPGGAPRLLIIAASADTPGGRDFLYAECGLGEAQGAPDSCFDPSGWSIARVASNQESSMGNFFELLLPLRTFAVDHAGNPRFVMTDSNYSIEPDRYGAFYMSCDGGCADARKWTETNLANHLEYRTEQFNRPVLALGPSGSAHLLAWVYAFAPDGTDMADELYYYECAADCTDRANWRRVSVINQGSGTYPTPTWDLGIDAAGRPRAAVFLGGASQEPDLDYSLIYFWCDAACTSDTGWAGWLVQSGSFGESPALAIDAAGRPRIAFLSPDALPVIAACNEDCQGDAPDWSALVFEGEPDMAADRPTALPFTCDGELWNALSPDLALGPDGRAHVAYDVSVQARCLYQEFMEPEITYEFHEIWRGARLATLPPLGAPAPDLSPGPSEEASTPDRPRSRR